MTPEEKNLLLKDLCARLPYRTFVQTYHYNTGSFEPLMPRLLEAFIKDDGLEIKPYLRPMSSMTEEEKFEYDRILSIEHEGYLLIEEVPDIIDFYNSKHLDYRGLIPMGLALEAPEDMYKI